MALYHCPVCGAVVFGPFIIEPLCHDCCIWADDLIWGFDTCL